MPWLLLSRCDHVGAGTLHATTLSTFLRSGFGFAGIVFGATQWPCLGVCLGLVLWKSTAAAHTSASVLTNTSMVPLLRSHVSNTFSVHSPRIVHIAIYSWACLSAHCFCGSCPTCTYIVVQATIALCCFADKHAHGYIAMCTMRKLRTLNVLLT